MVELNPKIMKIYSYIVRHDTGFAPNPFGGYCTLANCKPAIRRAASIGDWIVGLSRKANGNRMIFAMKVQEKLTFKNYFLDERFYFKRPNFKTGLIANKSGDNIYKPIASGKFKQLQSMHSVNRSKKEDLARKAHDLSGKNVLISKEFYYFGKDAISISPRFSKIVVGRGHKNKFSDKFISAFLKYLKSYYKKGINSQPSIWPLNDTSWKM
jgi:hypothetical protein